MHDACICVSWLFCCFQPHQSFLGPALVLFYYLNLVEALSNHLMTTHSAEQPQLKSNDESPRAILAFYKEEVMKQLDQMHRLENLMGIRRPTSDAMAREQLNSIIQRILMHQDWVKIHDWVSIQTRITACIVEEMQAEILRRRCQEWLRLPAFRSESSRRRAGLEYAMDNDPKLRANILNASGLGEEWGGPGYETESFPLAGALRRNNIPYGIPLAQCSDIQLILMLGAAVSDLEGIEKDESLQRLHGYGKALELAGSSDRLGVYAIPVAIWLPDPVDLHFWRDPPPLMMSMCPGINSQVLQILQDFQAETADALRLKWFIEKPDKTVRRRFLRAVMRRIMRFPDWSVIWYRDQRSKLIFRCIELEAHREIKLAQEYIITKEAQAIASDKMDDTSNFSLQSGSSSCNKADAVNTSLPSGNGNWPDLIGVQYDVDCFGRSWVDRGRGWMLSGPLPQGVDESMAAMQDDRRGLTDKEMEQWNINMIKADVFRSIQQESEAAAGYEQQVWNGSGSHQNQYENNIQDGFIKAPTQFNTGHCSEDIDRETADSAEDGSYSHILKHWRDHAYARSPGLWAGTAPKLISPEAHVISMLKRGMLWRDIGVTIAVHRLGKPSRAPLFNMEILESQLRDLHSHISHAQASFFVEPSLSSKTNDDEVAGPEAQQGTQSSSDMMTMAMESESFPTPEMQAALEQLAHRGMEYIKAMHNEQMELEVLSKTENPLSYSLMLQEKEERIWMQEVRRESLRRAYGLENDFMGQIHKMVRQILDFPAWDRPEARQDRLSRLQEAVQLERQKIELEAMNADW